MKKSQTWSLDIIIAVSVFLIAFTLFYMLISQKPADEVVTVLTEESQVVVKSLESEQQETSFIKGNELDEDALEEFKDLDYEKTKAALGIKSDYCIHFEDEEGNIINVSGMLSVGSPNLTLILDDSTQIICGID